MKKARRPRARGGRGGAEPRARIRLRELHVMEQTLEGRTQHQIAASLGISQPAVCKIVQRLEDRLLADVAWKVERHRARQTMRLEFLYGEAIRAWRNSQQQTLRKRQRQSGVEGKGTTVAEIVSENSHGDPRFLEEARRALQDLRSVWGVNAPERLSVETSSPYTEMSNKALEDELARQLTLIHAYPRGLDPATAAAVSTNDDE